MSRSLLHAALSLLALSACASGAATDPAVGAPTAAPTAPDTTTSTAPADGGVYAAPPIAEGQAQAVFAGGCFWCMETAYEGMDGVLEVLSGYTGGAEDSPTYRQVANHMTSHYEAVQVIYDPTKTDYEALLDIFWHNVDPTQANGQFCDKGDQYRTAIFTSDAAEIAAAEQTRERSAKVLSETIVTEILPSATFWVAEEYHQDFYKKSPGRYYSYRTGCGRDKRLEQLWGEAPESAVH